MKKEFNTNDQFGHFKLLELIGEGGSAKIWKAEKENGHVVALKTFSPYGTMSEDQLKTLLREFKKIYDLDHPGIIDYLSYGEVEGIPFLEMALYEGSLMSLLQDRIHKTNSKPPYFSEKEIAELLTQVGGGLNYLHEKKIIHQDIKPGNLLYKIDERGQIKIAITDFGISSRSNETILNTSKSQQNIGLSPDYAAPEQFRGEVYTKSDVFSLAVSLYELIEGDTPTKNNVGIGQAINAGAASPSPPSVPSRIANFIKLCLNKNYKHRPSAKDAEEYGRFFLKERYWPIIKPIGPVPPKPPPPDPPTHSKRPGALMAAGLIITIVLLAIAYIVERTSISALQNGNMAEALQKHKYISFLPFSLSSTPWNKFAELNDQGYHLNSPFRNEVAVILNDNKEGYINSKGEVILECQYDDCLVFSNGYGICGNYLGTKAECSFVTDDGKTSSIKYNFCQIIHDSKPPSAKVSKGGNGSIEILLNTLKFN